ncbi:MAG TPA: 7-carboxy-7-deazaguanine synthase QueE [Bacteroidia bacterium]|nr:7-carboxy-7-deazaguanine synthase QueE [Bacteroidia bacterium]
MTKSKSIKQSNVLPVMEHFYTIQGEGMHSGSAAYFIRLGGCDVGCHWCDVKESWDVNAHPLIDIDKLIEEVKKAGASIVVITGGEPAMHNLKQITAQLKRQGIAVHIETSGSSAITGKFDWVCLSPKKLKTPLKESFKLANELKIIIYNKDDFDWAEKNAALVSKKCQLLLQPEWSRAEKVTPLIVEYVKKHPRWQVSLQTHKYMNVP